MDNKLVQIREHPTEGMGRGMFAVVDIKAGDCILDEKPLVCVPGIGRTETIMMLTILGLLWNYMPDGWEGWLFMFTLLYLASNVVRKLGEFFLAVSGVWRLGTLQRKAYYSLTTGYAVTESVDSDGVPTSGFFRLLSALMVFRANQLPNGKGTKTASEGRGAVYAHASVINHSCAPNAAHHWADERQREAIYAMKSIKKGEEITISYIDVFIPQQARKEALEHYNFVCKCRACELKGDELEASDTRRERCKFLSPDGPSGSRGMMRTTEDVLEESQLMLDAIDKEFGDPTYKGEACWEAHVIAFAASQTDKKWL